MRCVFCAAIIASFLFPSPNWAANYTSKTERIEAVKKLEQKFDANKKHYMSRKYHEDDVRRDFIDPLFETLGWDILNNKQVLLYQQDSVPEARLSIFGYPKRIDYSQRIDDRFVFFIEAKAADKDLSDKDYIFQAKRYCWSSGTTDLVILTGYAGMRVYDCRIKPDYNKPEQGELKQFRMSYDQYDEKYDLLWDAFGKSNVQQGSIKKLLKSVDKTAERIPMESALVSDLEKMRLAIATDILKNNPDLSEKQISAASQTILNKILFTRILEDRDIITTKRLYYAVASFYKDTSLFLGDKGHYFRNSEKMHEPHKTLFLELRAEFSDFAKMFNGAIFSDTSADGLIVSNDVLKDIVLDLYKIYDFSVVPLHVIGKAYESYLGKTITIKKGGVFSKDKLVMRDRPEVKSAGGVFYTPAWVAKYMTEETLGQLLSGKTPAEFEKIKLLDPACGSGVFPATAAQLMFDTAADYYAKHPSKIGGTKEFPDAIKLSTGKTVLGSKKRAEIIKNSIFCVDTDAQAIENTKMLLYIMILENSGISTAQKERKSKFQTKAPFVGNHESFALPDLNDNIICANSLVGTDFGNAKQNLDAKAFDWDSDKIAKIIKNGGFDVVIGNPPYIRNQKLQTEIPEQYEYMKKHYKTISKGNTDIFYAFFEKGQSLLKSNGRMGLIVSASALTSKSAANLRGFLSNTVYKIINFGGNKVFPGVGVASTIIFTTKNVHNVEYTSFEYVDDIHSTFMNYLKGHKNNDFYSVMLKSTDLQKTRWSFGKMDSTLKKMGKATVKLGDIANVFQGQSSGANDIFLISKPENFEKECIRPYIRSKDVRRYMPVQGKEWIIYAYDVDGKLLSEKEFKKRCPKTYSYMFQHKSTLLKNKERNDKDWFKLARNTNYKLCLQPKIFTNFVDKEKPQDFAIETTGGLFIPGFSFAVSTKTENISNEMLLGVLNSKLIHDYLYENGKNFGKKKEVNVPKLKDVPLVPLTNSNLQIYKDIESLVIDIMNKKSKGQDTRDDEIKIDVLVNKLYGISIAKKAANDNKDKKMAA